MRLFIALNLTSKERQRIYRAARKLREADLPVRWVEHADMHLTLKFLGEVRPESAGKVRAAIERVAAKTSPFQLSLGGCGAFPTIRRPRVIWVGAEATPELRCLKHDLEWELAPLGFEREVRAFHPHLTLGRARSSARAGDFRDFQAFAADYTYEGEARIRTVDLMVSHLSSKGVRYEKLHSVRLGNPVSSQVKKAG